MRPREGEWSPIALGSARRKEDASVESEALYNPRPGVTPMSFLGTKGLGGRNYDSK